MTDYYFIFCPNNSGTTVISQYLADQVDGYLPPFGNFEGQWAPAVKDVMLGDRWNEKKAIDWAFVRAEWEKLRAEAGGRPFIEASPPNLIRVDEIRRHFDGSARYLFAISNPYQQIASSIYNYYDPSFDRFEWITRVWLRRARHMKRNIETHPDIPLLTYDDFCATPGLLNERLAIPARPPGRIDGKGNTRLSDIQNMRDHTIAFLTAGEIDRISAFLRPFPEILEFFGYDLMDGDSFLDVLTGGNPAAREYGLRRRSAWEAAASEAPGTEDRSEDAPGDQGLARPAGRFAAGAAYIWRRARAVLDRAPRPGRQ